MFLLLLPRLPSRQLVRERAGHEGQLEVTAGGRRRDSCRNNMLPGKHHRGGVNRAGEEAATRTAARLHDHDSSLMRVG